MKDRIIDWNKEDSTFMKLAFRLALKGRGRTLPNPMVGAVVAANGKVVGRGYHPEVGAPHAEVFALREADERSKNATLYVNLEPCCVHGRTPPCTDAIIAHGIGRVVCATRDPNPRIDGRSIGILEQNGIRCDCGLLEEEGRILNEVYFKNVLSHLPFVTLKIASTLDGKIADRTFSSRWITGARSRKEVHRIRSYHRGILVGINTVLKDDPRLTVRRVKGDNPFRLILDPDLLISQEKKLVRYNSDGKTIVCTTEDSSTEQSRSLTSSGVILWRFPADVRGKIDLEEVLKKCYDAAIYSLLVEGGGATFASFLGEGCVDRVIFVFAPKILGAQHIPSVGDIGIDTLSECLRLTNTKTRRIGEDTWIEGLPLFDMTGDNSG
jgi:diaminohydroxyphosphoribosylaminopyrimidine deaminase/5-amino-6-(5-phosphoribosylamino)uracil reductase